MTLPSIKKIEWSDPSPPISGGSPYDHVRAFLIWEWLIEWKSWKKYDSYTIYMDGNFIGNGVTLEDAKEQAQQSLETLVMSAIEGEE